VHRAPVPVVSLGNLTAGGTGKTPMAAFVARWYRERNVRVCFLSRGYGAMEGGLNDEALVLEQLCPDVPHLQNPDRVASARIAHEELESQLLILDDGFQHRQLARDLDIVLIDASNPWGFGGLLPRGLLREPPSGLSRAALAVITRVDQVSPETAGEIRRQISALAPRCDVAEAAFPFTQFINAGGTTAPLALLRGRPIAAFCGIGNPEAFRKALENAGFMVAAFRSFPDHFVYSRADVDDLSRWIAGVQAEAVVVTQKDVVKICQDRLAQLPLWAVQIGTEIRSGQEAIDRHLGKQLARIHD
jgi:tetraacyldisaccharide 4'-kinase